MPHEVNIRYYKVRDQLIWLKRQTDCSTTTRCAAGPVPVAPRSHTSPGIPARRRFHRTANLGMVEKPCTKSRMRLAQEYTPILELMIRKAADESATINQPSKQWCKPTSREACPA